MKLRSSEGFTLIELLLVIGIIAILASIVIVALNPTERISDARDAQRKSDIHTILNAVYNYAVDNEGELPGNIGTTPKEICRITVAPDKCIADNGVNLRTLSGGYISIPADPSAPSSGTGTYYTIFHDGNKKVTVTAWATEKEATDLSASR